MDNDNGQGLQDDPFLVNPQPKRRPFGERLPGYLVHFFTASGRPFCMYAVIAGPRHGRRHQLLALDRVLRSLRIDPRSAA